MIPDRPAEASDDLAALPRRALPAMPSRRSILGASLIWMTLAQGTGALLAWPYLVAKYGLTFVWLLIPVCLLQYPLNVEIGRYTLVTGESVLRGFFRVHRCLGAVVWMVITILAVLSCGAFASVGGTALATLTGLPASFGVHDRSLSWTYGLIAASLAALVLTRAPHRLVTVATTVVAAVTFAGLLWACTAREVTAVLPAFLGALTGPGPSERGWDVHDASRLLSTLVCTGLAGPWLLLYSYWLRDAGLGMAGVTGEADGALIDDSATSAAEWPIWRRALGLDAAFGVAGYLAATLMTCLLAYAFIFPRGLFPEGYEIVVAESAAFGAHGDVLGRQAFLALAAVFVVDAWLVIADGTSRLHADLVTSLFPSVRRRGARGCYLTALGLFAAVTSVAVARQAPPAWLPLATTVAGMVILPPALFVLNYRRLRPVVAPWVRPRARGAALLAASFLGSAILAVAWIWSELG